MVCRLHKQKGSYHNQAIFIPLLQYVLFILGRNKARYLLYEDSLHAKVQNSASHFVRNIEQPAFLQYSDLGFESVCVF